MDPTMPVDSIDVEQTIHRVVKIVEAVTQTIEAHTAAEPATVLDVLAAVEIVYLRLMAGCLDRPSDYFQASMPKMRQELERMVATREPISKYQSRPIHKES